MGIRNVPRDAPARLSDLVSARPGTVASRSLTRGAPASMTLLAFSTGESVSEEAYGDDVMYLVVEGSAVVSLPAGEVELDCGETIAVDAGVLHAVRGATSGEGFKILQISMP